MVMWLEVMFDEMNCLFQNHWTHILPGPIHWCKICLKVSPWDTDSLRTNDRNLCQRVVVVCCGQVKPPKTFKNYAMFNMLKGEFVHFFSSWQCVASLTNVYMLLHTILIFDNFEIWEGPREIMGFYRASYDCICWVYNFKQFGDLLICWRPGDSIRLGRGRGNEVPKRGHVLQTSTY